jgi:prophage DNA circulation protein
MGWQERLGRVTIDGRPMIGGSFRGVPFFVEEADREGGRRGPQHEYPGRDVPYFEDTGRRARVFPTTAHVIGKNYDIAKNKLIQALEKSGPGELLHPYHGRQRVAVPSFRVKESRREGGIARFTIDFVEAGEGFSPLLGVSAVADVLEKTDSAFDAIAAGQNALDLSPLTSELLQPIEDVLSSAAGIMATGFSPLLGAAQDVAEFRNKLDLLALQASEFAKAPFRALEAFIDALDFAFSPLDLRSLRKITASFDGFELGKLPASPHQTPSRVRQKARFEFMAASLRRVALVKAAAIAADSEFPVFGDAVNAQGDLVEKLGGEIDEADDDNIFQTLTDLRDAVVVAIPSFEIALQSRVKVTPLVTTPTLVLAHRLYGDVGREDEIIKQNRIRHPGFVVGGRSIEVITDADTAPL